jgi:cytochrome P450
MMVKFTSSVVISGFLGMESLKEQLKGQTTSDAILKLCSLAVDSFSDPLILIFGERLIRQQWRARDREFVQLRADINAILRSYITQAQEDLEKEDSSKGSKSIVKLLLAERKNAKQGEEEDFSITDEELADEIKTFVIAGSETTSNFLNAMLLYIFEKPAVAQKLITEIQSTIASDEDITVDNFKKLPYLDNVILETSRIFTSAPGMFTRETNEDTIIGGVAVKKGTLLDFGWLSIFYNPELFENPHEFIPERWEKEEYKQRQQLVSMIFSGGPRSCLGKNLALVEMRVMMIKFVQRYEQLAEAGRKKRAFDLGLTYHIRNSECTITKASK